MQSEIQKLYKLLFPAPLILLCGIFQSQVWASDTALLNAIRDADLNAISILSGSVGDINVSDHSGRNALMVVAKVGDSQLVSKLLSNGADPNSRNHNGGTPIMFAAISGDIPSMKLLIDKKADVKSRGSNGWSALMIAAAKGHSRATRLLLEAGAEANTRDIYLWTPLHRAAYENRPEVVRLLLNDSATDINAIDDQGATALHHAASRGNAGIVLILIKHGVDIELSDSNGRAPADYAVVGGHKEIAQLLRSTKGQVD